LYRYVEETFPNHHDDDKESDFQESWRDENRAATLWRGPPVHVDSP
jgi:hypothetical protein